METTITAGKLQKFTLPISPEYCGHWGIWEAVREIYQNALDAQDSEPDCEIGISWFDGKLLVNTSKGDLSTDTLILGKSSKRDDQSQRGKFGEGYKIALLVLAREGHQCIVYTDGEMWESRLEHDAGFNSTVLNIYVHPHAHREGVEFQIDGISEAEWRLIEANICESETAILDIPIQKGRIYVGGLYVYTAKEFHCGYSFEPGAIKLDRDRGMVSGFDLAWETSRLWSHRGDDRSQKLLKDKAPDVEYVQHHSTRHSAIATHALGRFYADHGPNVIPVSSQEEIELAKKAGMKWTLVPEVVKNLLKQVVDFVLPSGRDTPADLLKAFKIKWKLPADAAKDLDLIIELLEENN